MNIKVINYALIKDDAKLLSEVINEKNKDQILNDYNVTTLVLACDNGSIKCVKLLLKLGANPNLYGENELTPLYIASYRGHSSIVRELLRKGANTKDDTIIQIAAKQGHLNIVRELIRYGANYTVTELKKSDIINIIDGIINRDKIIRKYILQLALIRERGNNLLSDDYFPRDMFVELCKKIKILLIEN